MLVWILAAYIFSAWIGISWWCVTPNYRWCCLGESCTLCKNVHIVLVLECVYDIDVRNIHNKYIPRQWRRRSSFPPKKTKGFSSAGKTMATIFYDPEGILLISYLAKSHTINWTYCIVFMNKVKLAITENKLAMARKKVLFYDNNAPSLTNCIVWE